MDSESTPFDASPPRSNTSGRSPHCGVQQSLGPFDQVVSATHCPVQPKQRCGLCSCAPIMTNSFGVGYGAFSDQPVHLAPYATRPRFLGKTTKSAHHRRCSCSSANKWVPTVRLGLTPVWAFACSRHRFKPAGHMSGDSAAGRPDQRLGTQCSAKGCMTAVAFEPTPLLIATSSQRAAPIRQSVFGTAGGVSAVAFARGVLETVGLQLWGWNPLLVSAWRPKPTPYANRLMPIGQAVLATTLEVRINGLVGIAFENVDVSCGERGAGQADVLGNRGLTTPA